MAVNLSPIWGAGAQLLDNSGNVLSGGKIYTYLAGTTTPAVTYTSNNGSTANSNPIILNSAGRVPYEIWLTDSIEYKFVLKDSNDTLIGTWDNLIGINSNFINYYGQQEIQTATAGQTVFTLTEFQYEPGTGNLSVFVDGVNQYGPGAQYAYVETDSSTITFVSGLHVGASVKFTTTKLENPGVADASQVSYTYPDSNAVTQNVEERLAQYVSVKDFGATGDGVTDDTDAIQNAIDSATSAEGIYFPEGVYIVSAANAYTAALRITSRLTLYSNFATIKVASTSATGTITIYVDSDDVKIEGIRFAPNIITDLTNIFLAPNRKRLQVIGCEFVNPQSGGLYVAGYSEDVLFTDNKVYNLGYGILVNSSTGGNGYIVTDNMFVGTGSNDADAIEFNGLVTPITNVIISNNRISSYLNPSNPSAGFGIGLSYVEQGTVSNNTITSCSRNGIHLENNCKEITITGNSISECYQAGIEIQGENSGQQCSNIVISSNIVRHCATNPAFNLGRGSIDCGSSTTGATVGFGVLGLIITGNFVYNSAAYGIYTNSCRFANVSNNTVKNSVGYGICLVTVQGTMVNGNISTNDTGVTTQTYGLRLDGGVDGSTTVALNNFTGNATGGVSDNTNGASYIANAGAEGYNSVGISGGTNHLGFYSLATPITKPTVTGAKSGNAALNSLLTQLAALGLITNSTSA